MNELIQYSGRQNAGFTSPEGFEPSPCYVHDLHDLHDLPLLFTRPSSLRGECSSNACREGRLEYHPVPFVPVRRLSWQPPSHRKSLKSLRIKAVTSSPSIYAVLAELLHSMAELDLRCCGHHLGSERLRGNWDARHH